VSKDALRVLFNQYKRTGIQVVEAYDGALPMIQGNFANLGQVCLNILTNAIQAVSKDSGQIRVRTTHDKGSGRVVFECADNGPGISADLMKDIFKPFFTTKEVGKGTGLGLYLSHEIVRRHGGEIQVSSPSEGGSIFRVSLPVTRPDAGNSRRIGTAIE
jgi:signal transduction histidine kinase